MQRIPTDSGKFQRILLEIFDFFFLTTLNKLHYLISVLHHLQLSQANRQRSEIVQGIT